MRLLGLQAFHESPDGYPKLCGDGGGPLERRPLGIAFREERLKKGVITVVHGLGEVATQQVVILVDEALDAVSDGAREVPQPEALVRQRAVHQEVPTPSTLEVRVVLASLRQLEQEALVVQSPRPKALLVQQRQNTVVILKNEKVSRFFKMHSQQVGPKRKVAKLLPPSLPSQ